MNTFTIRLFLKLVLLSMALCFSQAASANPPLVAAASNLRFVMAPIEKAFAADTGLSVKTVYGSSGNFYRQIRQGAPFQVFLSADESYIKQLESAGHTSEPSFIYGMGRLVYFAPHGSTLDPTQGLQGLQKAVSEQRVKRFAIANPNHAPYGNAAWITLQNLSIAKAIRPTLIFGENISQAAQLATSESTDGGIFAYSLVFSERVSNKGSYSIVPLNLHPPLRQSAALLKGAGETATLFYYFLKTDKARQILSQFGFAPVTTD